MTWQIRILEDARWWLDALDDRQWRIADELVDQAATLVRSGDATETLVLDRDGVFLRFVVDHAAGTIDVIHVSEDDARSSRRPGGLLDRPAKLDDDK